MLRKQAFNQIIYSRVRNETTYENEKSINLNLLIFILGLVNLEKENNDKFINKNELFYCSDLSSIDPINNFKNSNCTYLPLKMKLAAKEDLEQTENPIKKIISSNISILTNNLERNFLNSNENSTKDFVKNRYREIISQYK